MSYYIPLFPSRLYHVFSRATGSEKLFKEEENYRYFLQKMNQHLSPVCFIRAYCLLPNHFHLVVEIKEENQIKAAFLAVKKDKVYNPEIISDFVMERFSNFLNSYTKSFNKRFNRKGSLFMDYLRRVEISSDAHLTAAIFYVHKIPVHHGLVKDINFWAWSSYQECISENPGLNSRKEVLDWFGGREGFLEFHSQGIEFKGFDEPA
jgi:REP element-mobilizing transposase RayT